MNNGNTEFDRYARQYDEDLNKGLILTGESKEYYIKGRISWLSLKLRETGCSPTNALDYGCGTGASCISLLKILNLAEVAGVDVSRDSIEEARRLYGSDNVDFFEYGEFCPGEQFDLVYCNGVFHHVPEDDRPEAVKTVYNSLKKNGIFCFWENNPWNPGTRICMSRVPFDRDAVMLSPSKAASLLTSNGFNVKSISYMFIFPGFLGAFRPLEPLLSRWPLGGQYMIIGEKAVE